jgi:nicotinate phosphoribosyltransferase
MDEYAIRDFFRDGGVADGFGPGTALTTSTDAPKMEGVYKLVAVERDGAMQPSMKLSTGKVTYPGAKSVSRVERDGEYVNDVLGLREDASSGEEQLVTVFEDGERVYDLPSLDEIRDRARRERRKLPTDVRRLRDPASFPVRIGDALSELTDDLRDDLSRQYG